MKMSKVLLHFFKLTNELMRQSQIANSVADDEFWNRFHIRLENNSTLQTILCPYLVTSNSTQRL